MAATDIVSSTGKGSAMTGAEYDRTLEGLNGSVEEKTGAYTVIYTDQGKTIQINGASLTMTMDAIATIIAAIDTTDFKVRLKNIHASNATIARSSTDTFDGATSITLAENASVIIQTNAANSEWLVFGPFTDKPDINGGTIDGAAINSSIIGGSTPAAVTGTTVTGTTVNASSTLQIGGVSITKTAAQINAVGLTLTAGSGGAAEKAISTNGLAQSAHGFGALPDLVTVFLECTTADGNYAVGDQIVFGGWKMTDDDAPPTGGITVYSDTTNVYVSVDASSTDDHYAADADGTAAVQLDSDDWKVVATAYKFA